MFRRILIAVVVALLLAGCRSYSPAIQPPAAAPAKACGLLYKLGDDIGNNGVDDGAFVVRAKEIAAEAKATGAHKMKLAAMSMISRAERGDTAGAVGAMGKMEDACEEAGVAR